MHQERGFTHLERGCTHHKKGFMHVFIDFTQATAVKSLYRTQSNRLLTPAFERTLGQLAGGGSVSFPSRCPDYSIRLSLDFTLRSFCFTSRGLHIYPMP
jgi:hypothetical protein